jgi:hypothetical protein
MKKLLLLLILSVFLIGCSNQISTNEVYESEEVVSETTKEGWSMYKNDVLGIEFEYKDLWGEPVIGPYTNLTKLSDVSKDFAESNNNVYQHAVIISFVGGLDVNKPNFVFFDDSYRGQDFPNGQVSDIGYIDNFPVVVNSEDICDYEFAYQEKQFTTKQLYKNCVESKYAEIIYYNEQVLTYYNYDFSMYSFEKLNNGYYDNLLLDMSIVRRQLQDDNLLDPVSLIPAAVASAEESGYPIEVNYELEKIDFEYLLSSIRTYSTDGIIPVNPKLIRSSNKDHQLIYNYYYNMARGDLRTAFDLNEDEGTSFGQFSEWYKDVYNTVVQEITELKEGEYEFKVTLFEHNTLPSTYLVVKRVEDGLLQSVRSDLILDELEYSEDLFARVMKRSQSIQLLIYNDGLETLIDRFDDVSDERFEEGFFTRFSLKEFSSDGRYLIIGMPGWESYSEKLYDIQNDLLIDDLKVYSASFTPDSKYIYDCSYGGMGATGGFQVISLIDGAEVLERINQGDLPEGIWGVECEYSKPSNSLFIEYFGEGTVPFYKGTYDFDSKTLFINRI